jgi:3-phosphoglycerate kinase
LDHTQLNQASESIKYLQERLARRIVVLTSLGDKVGRVKAENSLQILQRPLQDKISDMQVQIVDADAYIDHFEHQDELKENTCYILENLNFRPDENSYVEPWVDLEELKR